MISFQGASGPEMLSLWQAFRGGVFQTDGETRHIMYMDGFFLIQDNIFRHPIRIWLSFVLPNQFEASWQLYFLKSLKRRCAKLGSLVLGKLPWYDIQLFFMPQLISDITEMKAYITVKVPAFEFQWNLVVYPHSLKQVRAFLAITKYLSLN